LGSFLLTAVFAATDWQKWVEVAIPIVLGALVAGISAVVKASYERRDTRRRAQGQLELATRRTEFVRSWLDVSRSIDDDPDYLARVNNQARHELDNAYLHAQTALDEGRSALEHSDEETLGRQLLSLFLLEKRERFASYLAVAGYYLLIAGPWILVAAGDQKDDPQYWSRWQYAIFATVSTIVLRVIAGVIVAWIERRGPAAPTTAEHATALPRHTAPIVAPAEPPSTPAVDTGVA
jgi:hypothetical protein